MAFILDKLGELFFDPEPNEEESTIENEMIDDMDEDSIENEVVRDKKRAGKVVAYEKPVLKALDGGSSIKVVLFQPMCYEDSQLIVNNLRLNKPVIVNMLDLQRETQQRVLDFMYGAVYALNGAIRRVSYAIYVIVPADVTIIGHGEEEEDGVN